jgi:hypothetical protein
VAGVAACDDPFELRATRPNTDMVIEVWALTGTAPTLPSVLLVPVTTVSRPDAAGSFDVAFDINAEGKLVVLPVGSVVSPIIGSRTILFQKSSGPFLAVTEAPRRGWSADSSVVLDVGDVLLLRVPTAFCQFEFRQEVYAKLVVDSILVGERRMKLGARINPNCGFRSFQDGIPEF